MSKRSNSFQETLSESNNVRLHKNKLFIIIVSKATWHYSKHPLFLNKLRDIAHLINWCNEVIEKKKVLSFLTLIVWHPKSKYAIIIIEIHLLITSKLVAYIRGENRRFASTWPAGLANARAQTARRASLWILCRAVSRRPALLPFLYIGVLPNLDSISDVCALEVPPW